MTGAAGQIAYSLLYSIAKGDVFGPNKVRIYKVYDIVVPHSSSEVPAQFPMLCLYLMGSNGSSAYHSASRGTFL